LIAYILIFFLAIITSIASVMVGLGGGLLLIPLIVLIFDLPIKYIAGTMLFAMVPYTLVAIYRNRQKGYVNFKIGLSMEAGSVTGVMVGAHLTGTIPDTMLKILFILVVLYLMVTLRIPNDSPYNYVARLFRWLNHLPPYGRFTISSDTERKLSFTALFLIGFLAGIFSGMLGIGGGFLKTPVLIVGVMLPPKVAVGTSLFMIFITASTGAVTHALLDHIHLPIALTVTAGMILGAYLGTGFFRKMPDENIKRYIFLTMLVAAVLTLFR
jgi:uncharacterized membrane protein YfcA